MAAGGRWEQGRKCILSGGDTDVDAGKSDAKDENTRTGSVLSHL